ncbi:MAG: 4Fe-4S binding protein [Ruminococcus sp.]
MKKLTRASISAANRKKIQRYVRGGIQLLFFLFLPAAFTTAFSGVKYIFTQIGLSNPIGLTSFVTVLLALCAYTIIFGRFFCGYACAFGTLGDAVHSLYVWCCKKLGKKPIQLKKTWKKPLSFLKYVILLAILLLCFIGVYSKMTGWSPWDVFSMLHAGNLKLGGYVAGIILLVGILVGMAFCERFFCRFLCPMGAVFSLLPILPLFSPRRKKESCIKGCSACQRCCPSDIELPENGSWKVNGDCFQCQKCVQICPKQNATNGRLFFRGNEVWFTVLRAVVLAVVLILAGV